MTVDVQPIMICGQQRCVVTVEVKPIELCSDSRDGASGGVVTVEMELLEV